MFSATIMNFHLVHQIINAQGLSFCFGLKSTCQLLSLQSHWTVTHELPVQDQVNLIPFAVFLATLNIEYSRVYF